MAGLYIHVPFCAGKCPYCDFYSRPAAPGGMESYIRQARAQMKSWAGARFDTVYFGGGTPSLLGVPGLSVLLDGARSTFSIAAGAEITLEANPTGVSQAFFEGLRQAGFNRLSMGMQSADPGELHLLGRRHTPEEAAQAVKLAQAAGLFNISLDIMLGLPGGGREKLGKSIRFAAGLGVGHISAYILKIEPGTPFAEAGICLPEDDEVAEQYLFCVQELGRLGYRQYEISNFARPGLESRHNLTYWHGEEYLGIGPGAHSFWGGRRFYYPQDLDGFLQGQAPIEDGPGGGPEEFAMLRLRLNQGLVKADCIERFGEKGGAWFEKLRQNAGRCPAGLVKIGEESVSFTPEGFLVSNALILRLLEGAVI